MTTATKTLVAFHGDKKIKAKYLGRVRAHAKADRLIQGQGWEGGKGCAVGCTLEAYDHSRYPAELGIPVHIAYLEDSIFEGLPKGEAMGWPERFLSAIKPGADLSLVYPQFIVWTLTDPKDGVVRFTTGDTEKAVRGMSILFERRIKGDEPTEKEWSEAAEAARAAWAAEAARAARAAEAAELHRMAQVQADKLIELIKAAPVRK